MKVMPKEQVDVVTDVLCDICGDSTSQNGNCSPQFGTLQAHWEHGSGHNGEEYEVHLCEHCFFVALASLKEQRRTNQIFSEEGIEPAPEFGLVKRSREAT